MRNLFFLLMTAPLILWSCQKENENKQITILDRQQLSQSIYADENLVTIDFESTLEWYGTVSSKTPGSWVKLQKRSGLAGKHSLTVKFSNNTSDMGRTAVVHIQTVSQHVKAIITQQPRTNNGEIPPPSGISFNFEKLVKKIECRDQQDKLISVMEFEYSPSISEGYPSAAIITEGKSRIVTILTYENNTVKGHTSEYDDQELIKEYTTTLHLDRYGYAEYGNVQSSDNRDQLRFTYYDGSLEEINGTTSWSSYQRSFTPSVIGFNNHYNLNEFHEIYIINGNELNNEYINMDLNWLLLRTPQSDLSVHYDNPLIARLYGSIDLYGRRQAFYRKKVDHTSFKLEKSGGYISKIIEDGESPYYHSITYQDIY